MLRKTASTKVDPRLPLLIIFMYFLKLEKYSKNPLNVPILMMRRNFSDLNESDNLDTCDISELGHLGQHENNTKSVYRTQSDRISNDDITGGQPSQKKKTQSCAANDHNPSELYNDSYGRNSGELADTKPEPNPCQHSRNFILSPKTTDYDSICGESDSLSIDTNAQTDYAKLHTRIPVLEDGPSGGQASDTENNLLLMVNIRQ